MPGAAASPYAFVMIAIWWIGVVLLGFALAYAVMRAGRLRRDERARLDRATQAMVDEDARARPLPEQQPASPRPSAKPAVPGLFVMPGAVACLAIVLIIVATALRPPPANQATTTGQASGQSSQNQAGAKEQPVEAPVRPGNEPGSDSARGNKEPLTKRQ